MRLVSLESEFGQVELGESVRLGSKLRGTGLPPVSVQWFEGAGEGANYRGSRPLARSMDLPFKFYGEDRSKVWDLFSQVARIFAPSPTNKQVRFRINLDGVVWYSDIVRTGGGDFSWDEDTDGKTFLKSVITVRAGDPYWTQEDSYSQPINPGGLGRGLIKTPNPRLSQLKLSTNNSLGAVAFENPGDVIAYPEWTLNGPFTGFVLESPLGETLAWQGIITAGHWVKVNTKDGTITDDTGTNRYGGRLGIPQFWGIPIGESIGTIQLADASLPNSGIVVVWNPRKWMLF